MAFNQKFDFIIGGGILHHLDLSIVLPLIRDHLHDDGKMVFIEPLDINPVAKMVRYLTPHARTVDELPFRMVHLNTVRTYFNLKISAFEFFAVPFGVLSRFVFSDKQNWLTKMAFFRL